MKPLSEKVFQKIKEEKITPTPKWVFLLKRSVVWGAFGLSIILGAVAFSFARVVASDSDWDVYLSVSRGFWEYFLMALPFLWLAAFALLVFVAVYNFKHTRKGYLYALSIVVLFNIGASVALGQGLYSAGLGEVIHNTVSENIPVYGKILDHKKDIWSRPNDGLLSGKVVNIGSGEFTIEDFDGNKWEVKEGPKDGGEKVGQIIKLRGERTGTSTFEVEEVRHWKAVPKKLKNSFKNDKNGTSTMSDPGNQTSTINQLDDNKGDTLDKQNINKKDRNKNGH